MIERTPIKTDIVERKYRIWYIKGININFSFKSLQKKAEELGANINEGDYLIADNKNGDKRKAFRKSRNGAIIVYASVESGREFATLGKDGKINGKKPLIDWFSL